MKNVPQKQISDAQWNEEYLKRPFSETMTMRDYFAVKAMQAMCDKDHANANDVSLDAYFFADAMLKARAK